MRQKPCVFPSNGKKLGFRAATKVSEKISRAARVLYATKQNPKTFWSWRNFDGFTPCIQKICLLLSLLSLDEENLQLSVKTIFFKLDSLVIPRCFWLLPLMILPIVDIATCSFTAQYSKSYHDFYGVHAAL